MDGKSHGSSREKLAEQLSALQDQADQLIDLQDGDFRQIIAVKHFAALIEKMSEILIDQPEIFASLSRDLETGDVVNALTLIAGRQKARKAKTEAIAHPVEIFNWLCDSENAKLSKASQYRFWQTVQENGAAPLSIRNCLFSREWSEIETRQAAARKKSEQIEMQAELWLLQAKCKAAKL